VKEMKKNSDFSCVNKLQKEGKSPKAKFSKNMNVLEVS